MNRIRIPRQVETAYEWLALRLHPLGEVLSPGAIRLGHYYFPCLLAAEMTGAAASYTNSPWLVWPGDVLWPVAIVVLICHFTAHAHVLCERCLDKAPTLDPQAAVERWNWALRFTHARRLKALLFTVVGANLIFNVFYPKAGWKTGVAASVTSVILIVYWTAITQHSRLTAWCPWCHWGGRGDDEDITPDVPAAPAVV